MHRGVYTNFINPQVLSSALTALCATASGLRVTGFIKFIDSVVHAYNYYLIVMHSMSISQSIYTRYYPIWQVKCCQFALPCDLPIRQM